MKTELSPLQALEKLVSKDYVGELHNYECYKIIETALNDYLVYKQDYERVMKEKNSLLKEYAKSQKEHKVLEIIKKKRVNVRAFLKSLNVENKYQLQSYLLQCEEEDDELTQDEYEILKEVLK